MKALHDSLILIRNKVYAHTDEQIQARGIKDMSDLTDSEGPIFVTAWNPLNRDILPAISDLAAAREQRFLAGAMVAQRIMRATRVFPPSQG